MLDSDDPTPAEMSTSSPSRAVGASATRTWAWSLAAALAAGTIAWAVAEKALVPEVGFHAEKEKIDVQPVVAGTWNGVISFGALGAALGLCLGLTGGMLARSFPRSVGAGLIGLLAGGAAGGVLSWFIIPGYYGRPQGVDLSVSLWLHGGIWVGVGAAAGVAFGIGLGGRGAMLRGLIGGAGAALLATVIYEFAGGIWFPGALTDRPISQTLESRLAARLLVAVLVAAGVVIAADSTGPKKTADETRA